jgi:hypothetical protein
MHAAAHNCANCQPSVFIYGQQRETSRMAPATERRSLGEESAASQG